MSDADGSEFQMSSDDRLDSVDEARSNSDHGVVQLEAMAIRLYQDEPLAISRIGQRMTAVGNGRAEIKNPGSITMPPSSPDMRKFLLQSMNFPLYICNFSI